MSDHRFDDFTFIEIVEEFYRRIDMMKDVLDKLGLIFEKIKEKTDETS